MFKVLENQNEFYELKNNGVVLLDFYAPWCGPCKMLTPVLEEIGEESNDVTIIKINVDEFHEIAAEYRIEVIPTLFLLKDGETVNKNVGFMPKPAVIKFINSAK